MTGRWTNLALLLLVPLAAVSGLVMFVVGSGPAWPVAVLHGIVGLTVVALVPWKSVVVRRGLRRLPRPGRTTSLTLMLLVLAALASGVAHMVGVLFADAPVTTMQLHVGAGLAAAVLTLVHARHRRVRARRADLSRRSLLRAAAVVSVAGVIEATSQAAAALVTPPGIRRPTGSFRIASSAVEAIPVTSWLFDAVPPVADRTAWRLTVVGPEGAHDWSLAELGRWNDEQIAILDCTGGWWTEPQWSGVKVARLFPEATKGTVTATSATGYSRRLPLGADLLLATAGGGRPLSLGHGSPARLVVPGRRGYHWVKWVVRLEYDNKPWWVEPPLPLR